MSDVTLHLGDCLPFMRGLPDGSVDLIFADPPFNVGVAYNSYKDRRADYREWCAEWIAEGFRVLAVTGTFYSMTITRHLEFLYPLMAQHGVFINQVNWKNVASANGGRCYWNAYQPILVYGKTENYIFNRLAQTRKTLMSWSAERKENMRGQLLDWWDDIPYVYAGSICHSEAVMKPGTNQKAHPAQMPVALPQRAIMFSTAPGSRVLDPFMGVGPTGVACIRTGREFIGCELDPHYHELAVANTDAAQAQMLLPGFA